MSDDVLVELWLLDQFARLGFDGDAIAALLAWGVDYREAERLVRAGCPLDLALRILRPDTPVETVEPGVAERIQAYA